MKLQCVLVRQFGKVVNRADARLMMVPNGAWHTANDDTRRRLQAMGLIPGAPDLVLLVRGGRLVWIEVKLYRTIDHEFTDLDDTQRDFHAELRALGFVVEVVRSLDELWAIVERERVPHRPFPVFHRQGSFDYRRRRRSA